MSQHISTVGQIATDPKIFTPENGVQFCTFRLASTERRFDAQRKEWIDGDTTWFTINTFRSLATHANASFTKGDRIVVTGRLRVRQWEKEEKKGTSIEIDADGIGHDVRWGVSSFTKRSGQQEQLAPEGTSETMPAAPPAETESSGSRSTGTDIGAAAADLVGAPF